MTDDGQGYVRGPATYDKPHARLETKPSTRNHRRKRDTGGGYERVRSWEHDPTKAGDRKRDVYVSHHRLLAVVWCYPDDMAVGEILNHLDGKDIHHRNGVEWDNRENNLAVREHSRHAEITQAQMRAYAEDAKRDARGQPSQRITDGCDQCGDDADILANVEGADGEYCLACARDVSDVTGGVIEL